MQEATGNSAARSAVLPSGTVTFLFTDIEESTQRWERHREAMAAALERHDALVRGAVEGHGGYVFKKMGDAVCAAFATVPQAIAAALDAQRAIGNEDFSAVDGLKVRMAVHVGHADERDSDYFGPAVNRTARLLAIGYGGQVLVSGPAADLTQGELPAQATVRDLGAHRLKDLTQPEQVYQLVAPDLQQKFFPLRSLETLPNNLPLQLTPLVGRDADIAEIEALFHGTRLLSLVGAGGIGKTRVALQIGANLADAYSDGVWFVDLALVSDPALVAESAATALDVAVQPGRPATDALTNALRSKTALLILDNCEHVVAAVAQLAEALLRAAPNVRILATSREPLGSAGETAHRVPSLRVPDSSAPLTADAAPEYGALALFVERAKAANTRFALTDSNAPVVARICEHLDGIALAIELAAARAKALSVDQLASMLDERFRLLSGGSRTALPRQQTLRALFDWSHGLLSEREQRLFRRMAVFAGGCTLEAAETVCADDEIAKWDVVELLVSLVDKSLVLAEPSEDEQRYRLLETTRAYALERLQESGERERVRETHARWMLAFAEHVTTTQSSTPWRTWVNHGAAEIDNVRAALEWSLIERHDPLLGARVVTALRNLLPEAMGHAEVWRWCEGARDALGEAAPPDVLALLLVRMGGISGTLGYGLERREELHRRGLELARQSGDPRVLGEALAASAYGLIIQSRSDEALAAATEGLANARKTGDRRTAASCLVRIGQATTEAAARRQAFDEAAALYRAVGDDRGLTSLLVNRAEREFHDGDAQAALASAKEAGLIARKRKNIDSLQILLSNVAAYRMWLGEIEEGIASAREALALIPQSKSGHDATFNVQHLAAAAAASGDLQRAARLLGFCDTRLVAIDELRQKTEQMECDRLRATLQTGLEEGELHRLMAEGATWTEEQAVQEALLGA